jgi:hypothetical protein
VVYWVWLEKRAIILSVKAEMEFEWIIAFEKIYF